MQTISRSVDIVSLTDAVKSYLFSTVWVHMDPDSVIVIVYSSQYVKTFYIAWRKIVRRICFLPFTTIHCGTLPRTTLIL